MATYHVSDRQLLEMRIENYRRNRETCAQVYRIGFDQLIAQTERELRSMAVTDAGRQRGQPADLSTYSGYAT
jgi:hypothetical protein